MNVLWTTNTPGHRICIDLLQQWDLEIGVKLYPGPLSGKAQTVFLIGTPKIGKRALESGPLFLNLHGGDPQQYRGHDCLWWAIMDRNWNAVVTTLHVATDELDGGDILSQIMIKECRAKDIYAENMQNCAWLIWNYLNGSLSQRKQKAKGRMCPRMSAEQKAEAERMWDERLQQDAF